MSKPKKKSTRPRKRRFASGGEVVNATEKFAKGRLANRIRDFSQWIPDAAMERLRTGDISGYMEAISDLANRIGTPRAAQIAADHIAEAERVHKTLPQLSKSEDLLNRTLHTLLTFNKEGMSVPNPMAGWTAVDLRGKAKDLASKAGKAATKAGTWSADFLLDPLFGLYQNIPEGRQALESVGILPPTQQQFASGGKVPQGRALNVLDTIETLALGSPIRTLEQELATGGGAVDPVSGRPVNMSDLPGGTADKAMHALTLQRLAENWGRIPADLVGIGREAITGASSLLKGGDFFGRTGFDINDVEANRRGIYGGRMQSGGQVKATGIRMPADQVIQKMQSGGGMPKYTNGGYVIGRGPGGEVQYGTKSQYDAMKGTTQTGGIPQIRQLGGVSTPAAQSGQNVVGQTINAANAISPNLSGVLSSATGLQQFNPLSAANQAPLNTLAQTGAPVDVTPITDVAQQRASSTFGDLMGQVNESFGALGLGSSSARQAQLAGEARRLAEGVGQTGILSGVQAQTDARNRQLAAYNPLLAASGQQLSAQQAAGGLQESAAGLGLQGQIAKAGQLNQLSGTLVPPTVAVNQTPQPVQKPRGGFSLGVAKRKSSAMSKMPSLARPRYAQGGRVDLGDYLGGLTFGQQFTRPEPVEPTPLAYSRQPAPRYERQMPIRMSRPSGPSGAPVYAPNQVDPTDYSALREYLNAAGRGMVPIGMSDPRATEAWLRWMGPQRTHEGLMQTGRLMASSTGRPGMKPGSQPGNWQLNNPAGGAWAGYQTRQEGGYIDGPSVPPDQVPILAQGGEGVIPVRLMSKLRQDRSNNPLIRELQDVMGFASGGRVNARDMERQRQASRDVVAMRALTGQMPSAYAPSKEGTNPSELHTGRSTRLALASSLGITDPQAVADFLLMPEADLARYVLGATSYRPAKKASGGKVEKVMGEFKRGKLHSGSKRGPKVTNRKQAIAIGLSEARKAGEDVPEKKQHGGRVQGPYGIPVPGAQGMAPPNIDPFEALARLTGSSVYWDPETQQLVAQNPAVRIGRPGAAPGPPLTSSSESPEQGSKAPAPNDMSGAQLYGWPDQMAPPGSPPPQAEQSLRERLGYEGPDRLSNYGAMGGQGQAIAPREGSSGAFSVMGRQESPEEQMMRDLANARARASAINTALITGRRGATARLAPQLEAARADVSAAEQRIADYRDFMQRQEQATRAADIQRAQVDAMNEQTRALTERQRIESEGRVEEAKLKAQTSGLLGDLGIQQAPGLESLMNMGSIQEIDQALSTFDFSAVTPSPENQYAAVSLLKRIRQLGGFRTPQEMEQKYPDLYRLVRAS